MSDQNRSSLMVAGTSGRLADALGAIPRPAAERTRTDVQILLSAEVLNVLPTDPHLAGAAPDLSPSTEGILVSTFSATTPVSAAAAHPQARAVLEKHLPGILAEPELTLSPYTAVADLGRFHRGVGDPFPDLAPMVAELALLSESPAGSTDDEPAAAADLPTAGEQWGIIELAWTASTAGNPFVEVELTVTWHCGERRVDTPGFYDGDSTYRVRFQPPIPGRWSYRSTSTLPALDGHTGEVEVSEPGPGNHGPVLVHDRWHFRHADGTPFLPLGTTAYAWIHQPAATRTATLAALEGSGFTKLRMCVFPKSYHYNTTDPGRFPFERQADGSWDFTRFDVEYFRELDRRIVELAELGIEADVILFHPYDRWGFSQMPVEADQLYAAYVVRRLAAYRNVWWALANEFDFMPAKAEQDWEGIAAVIAANDPYGRLTSIHNGFVFYDHTRPWVTHCSIQSGDAESVGEWREHYGKPIVLDEAGYEGDLEYSWGNLTAEELVRRAWEVAVRGGYLNHGETFHDEVEQVWWSHGGRLRGESADRFRFLAQIIGETPSGRFEPLPGYFGPPCGGDADHRILYFGSSRPFRSTILTPDGDWHIDVIDTWAMTVDPLPGRHHGRVAVPLPSRPFMAIRLRAASAD